MPNDDLLYTVQIVYEVGIAKWRIDDPSNLDNAEWSLSVYDRNLEKWVNVNQLQRPGEYATIKKITLL